MATKQRRIKSKAEELDEVSLRLLIAIAAAESLVFLAKQSAAGHVAWTMEYRAKQFVVLRDSLKWLRERFPAVQDAYREVTITPVSAHDEAYKFSCDCLTFVNVILEVHGGINPVDGDFRESDSDVFIPIFRDIFSDETKLRLLTKMNCSDSIRVRLETELAKAKAELRKNLPAISGNENASSKKATLQGPAAAPKGMPRTPTKAQLAEVRKAIRIAGKSASVKLIQNAVQIQRKTLLSILHDLEDKGEYAGFSRVKRTSKKPTP